jgi:3-dehydroquinate dehydratase-2
MTRVYFINGPNLNLLGKREPSVYGTEILDDLNDQLKAAAGPLDMELAFFQTNSEGEIIDLLHRADRDADGVILNPGGYTHTSVAILDAMKAISVPVIEVHISNIYGREEFRRYSITAAGAAGVIAGFGSAGYILSLHAMKVILG